MPQIAAESYERTLFRVAHVQEAHKCTQVQLLRQRHDPEFNAKSKQGCGEALLIIQPVEMGGCEAAAELRALLLGLSISSHANTSSVDEDVQYWMKVRDMCSGFKLKGLGFFAPHSVV